MQNILGDCSLLFALFFVHYPRTVMGIYCFFESIKHGKDFFGISVVFLLVTIIGFIMDQSNMPNTQKTLGMFFQGASEGLHLIAEKIINR